MAGNILEQMQEQLASFTKKGQKLAQYCLEHPSEVEYLPISSLSDQAGVSEATITRFCRQLGLRGYNELKLELAKADLVTDLGDGRESPIRFSSEDSLETTIKKVYLLQNQSLSETLSALDPNSLTKAVELIAASDHCYCMGSGGSMVTAMEAWARFSTITNRFVHILDAHMQLLTIATAGEKDVILFFSYSGATRDMVDLFAIAAQRKVPIILVTHFPSSPAADLADVVLLCGCDESPLQSGSIAAKIGQMYVIECLFYAYCRRDPTGTSEARAVTAQAIARKLL